MDVCNKFLCAKIVEAHIIFSSNIKLYQLIIIAGKVLDKSKKVMVYITSDLINVKQCHTETQNWNINCILLSDLVILFYVSSPLEIAFNTLLPIAQRA